MTLFAFPYWNMGGDGHLCAGTMCSPKSLRVASMSAWEQAFFQSEFTHPGFADGFRTERGTAALWKSLEDEQDFPSGALLETETLAAYLQALESLIHKLGPLLPKRPIRVLVVSLGLMVPGTYAVVFRPEKNRAQTELRTTASRATRASIFPFRVNCPIEWRLGGRSRHSN
jgi:hypothetical protein